MIRNGRRKYLKTSAAGLRSYQRFSITRKFRRSIAGGRPGAVETITRCRLRGFAALPRAAGAGGRSSVVLGSGAISRATSTFWGMWRRGSGKRTARADALPTRLGSSGVRFTIAWSRRRRAKRGAIYGLTACRAKDLRKIARAGDRPRGVQVKEIGDAIGAADPGAVWRSIWRRTSAARTEGKRCPGADADRPAERGLRFTGERRGSGTIGWKAVGRWPTTFVGGVFNATPLEKYEELPAVPGPMEAEDSDAPDMAPTVFNLNRRLVRFPQDQPVLAAQHHPAEISRRPAAGSVLPAFRCPVAATAFAQGCERGRAGRRCLQAAVKDRGCVTCRKSQAFYMHELQMMFAAERRQPGFCITACRGCRRRSRRGKRRR